MARTKKSESAGSRLKQEILEVYSLNPAELLILDGASAIADALARIDAEVERSPLVVSGSAGQQVENPLLRAQREHASRLAALLDQIALPRRDEESGRSSAAQKAAQVRWSRAKRRRA